MLFERLPVIIRYPVHAIGGGDIAMTGHPERQGINERFTQDQGLGRTERRGIPDPGMLARQIEMFGGAPAEIITDFAPVQLVHLPLMIDNRDHQRAAQMFMAVFPQHPGRLQPAAYFRARFHFFRRQAVPQRAVGKAQLKLRH